MFHVKHRHQSGRLPARPTGRGMPPEPRPVLRRCRRSGRPGPRPRPPGRSPSSASPSSGQRSAPAPAARSRPTSRPTRTKPVAISAVTAGRAKLRAVTRSKRSRSSGLVGPDARPGPRAPRTRSSSPSSPDPRRERLAQRRADGLDRAHPRPPASSTASTRPGTPPPVPRSANRGRRRRRAPTRQPRRSPGRGRDGRPRSPGPRKPCDWARARTSRSSASLLHRATGVRPG